MKKLEEIEELEGFEIMQAIAYIIIMCAIGISFAVGLLIWSSYIYTEYFI